MTTRAMEKTLPVVTEEEIIEAADRRAYWACYAAVSIGRYNLDQMNAWVGHAKVWYR